MEQRTTVPRQAVLLALLSSAATLACGHRAGLINAIALMLALLLCVGFALAYRLRARLDLRDDTRRANDRRAQRSFAAGIGIPLVIDLLLWLVLRYDWLDADATVVVSLAITVGLATVLVSSMVDWYWVVPSALGLIGDPMWSASHDRRRGLGQVWVFQRGLCELLFLSCLALALAIVIVAIGNAFHDQTISTAVESLGGAGVAFGAVEFLAPRLGPALRYSQSAPIALGDWVDGAVSGLVVDVSTDPGLKVVGEDRRQRFVALADVTTVTRVDEAPMCETCRKRVILKHFARDLEAERRPPWWRRFATPRNAAIAARVLLVAFASCLLAAQIAAPARGPLEHMVSELVHGPAGPAAIVGFACWAVALALTAWLVAGSTRYGAEAVGVAVLLGVAAIAVVVLTIFPTQTDAGKLPEHVTRTTAGRLHDAGSGVAEIALLVAALTTLVAARRRPERFGLLVAAILAVATLATILGLAIGDSVGGLRQRLVLLCALTWLWLLIGDARHTAATPQDAS